MKIFDDSRHQSGRNYFEYQEKITRTHLLPLFRDRQVHLDLPILDVGCGTGGCVISLASALDVPVHGVDIVAGEVEVAREAAAQAGVKAVFEIADFVDAADGIRERHAGDGFGLILLRDVVEHLADRRAVFEKLHAVVHENGLVYVTFPPWHGPYAAHQHNALSKARYLPYLHAVAPNLFLKLLHRWESDREAWLRDVEQIFDNSLTRKRFEQTLRETGWEVRYLRTYFLRPAFIRMGLPKVSNGLLGRLPLVGDAFSTACEYLLSPA